MNDKEYENIFFFKNNDLGFVEFIIKNRGYVYNDFGGNKVEYKKLHKFDCVYLHSLGGGKVRTSVAKVCSENLNDLIKWLGDNRGLFNIGYSNCPCMENQNYKIANLNNILFSLKNKVENPPEIKKNSKQIIAEVVQDISLIKKFADTLIDIYNNKKVPKYNKNFEKAGFTKESMIQDKNKIFQMIILAAYDQQPFTRAARGWEPIWFELPELLSKLRLFTIRQVNEKSIVEIEDQLSKAVFYNYHINNKGNINTSYSYTFKDTAKVCQEFKLIKKMLNASSSYDVKQIQQIISGNIKNIGLMIASKIIMYTLREIGIGKARPEHFDLIFYDLLGEYHNNKFIKEIESKYSSGFIDQVIKELINLGDPLSIDALYYVDRDEPKLKDLLLSL